MAIEVNISEIVRKPELQSRAKFDMETVARYTTAMQEGAEFPPLTLYRVADNLLLVHGWHRLSAAEGAGFKTIAADVVDGTWDQAVTEAATSKDNQEFDTAGLPRSRADMRRQIVMFLSVEKNRQKSDNSIAKLLGVSHSTVATVRQERLVLDDLASAPQDNERVDAKGRTMDTSNIGSKSKAAARTRQTNKILGGVEPEVAQTAMALAETHAEMTGTEVTPSVLESAVEVAQEVASTGGFVDLGTGGQFPATEGTTIQALQKALDEKSARQSAHINGDRAIPLQTVYGKVIKAGMGKALFQFTAELEEKLQEFERYRTQYPNHVVKICIYMEDPVKALHRPSRPVAQPAELPVKPDWERIADGDSEPVEESTPEPTPTPEPEKPKAKRTRKPRGLKPNNVDSTTVFDKMKTADGELDDKAAFKAFVESDPTLREMFAVDQGDPTFNEPNTLSSAPGIDWESIPHTAEENDDPSLNQPDDVNMDTDDQSLIPF